MASSTGEATLRQDRSSGVLTLTLDRPERRNAIDPDLRDALAAAIDAAGAEPGVRGIVLTGAGGAFCAGGDLARFDELHDARAYRHVSHRLTDLVESLERLEKPVVAAVDGVVTGAGLALALACDWRVGSPRARVLFREGRIGLVPTHGGLTRLVKLLGLARAKEVLLGGEDLDADAALAAGLLSELAAPGEDVAARAHARVERMLARAPLSFAAAKRLLQLAADVDLRSGTLAESLAQTALLQSDDHREGLAAAAERREPEFKGELMATLIELDGVRPTIGRDVWLAPTAVLIGDVRVGDRANIWFGAVLRGDFTHIEVGEETSIQDNAVLHCADGLPTIVGSRVTVGHGAILEGCVVEDGALIGMGAVVCQHTVVGAGAVVAAGTVVSERQTVSPATLAAGVPSRERKALSGAAQRWTQSAADKYQTLRRRYLTNA